MTTIQPLSPGSSLPELEVANAQLVTPWLAVGGDLHPDETIAAAQLAELVEVGVTHIVDVRIEYSDELLVAELAPGVAYLHNGADDAGQRMPDEWFDAGVVFALDARDHGGLALAHCHMGVNRGPSMGYAALLAAGWDPVEAMAAIRRARPIAAVAYWEDALEWWARRSGAGGDRRRRDRSAVAAWRARNHLDVGAVIRRLREEGM